MREENNIQDTRESDTGYKGTRHRIQVTFLFYLSCNQDTTVLTFVVLGALLLSDQLLTVDC